MYIKQQEEANAEISWVERSAMDGAILGSWRSSPPILWTKAAPQTYLGTAQMFDVFDIQIPALVPNGPIEVRRRATAFGLVDQRVAYVGGVEFGRILRADEAYTDLEAWAGSTDRGSWTVLRAAPAARLAAEDDERWSSFLAALVSVLQAHTSWVVRCESDCDQQPLDRHEVSARRLSEIIDVRRNENAPLAILACPP